jgi:Uma2 family endonuclease
MIADGILNEYDDVELIEGVIRSKMSKGDAHEDVLEQLNRLLTLLLPTTLIARCQCAVTLDDSEPEPDISICEPARGRGGRKPGAADTFVVMEVSDTSLGYDRGDKLRVYAAAGIPVYWVVNVVDRQVEVYTDPVTPAGGAAHYRTRTLYSPGDSVPLGVRGQQVAAVNVADFMT